MNRYPGIVYRGKSRVMWAYYPGPDGKKKWERVPLEHARTKADGAAWRAQRIQEARSQPAPTEDPAPAATFDELLAVYRDVWVPRKRRPDKKLEFVKLMRKDWGAWTLDDITPEAAEAWVAQLQRPPRSVSPGTARSYALFCGHVYVIASRTAEGRKLLGARPNPFGLILLPPKPKARKAAYTVAQLEAVFRALAARRSVGYGKQRVAAERLWRWALLCIGCGLRVWEALKLRVGDVDLDRGIIHPDGKTGPRDAAVPDALLPALREWCEGRKPGELVVGTSVRRPPYELLARIFASVGVPWGLDLGMTMRSLRTTFVQAARSTPGLPLEDIADQAGHDVETLRASYASASIEQRRAVANAAAARFATVLLPSEGTNDGFGGGNGTP